MKSKKWLGFLLSAVMIFCMAGHMTKTVNAAPGVKIASGGTVTKYPGPAGETYIVTLVGATAGVGVRGKSECITYKKNGAKYEVHVSTNTGTNTRNSSIEFYEGNKKWILKFSQSAFTVGTSSVSFPATADQRTITTSYDGSYSFSAPAWITVKKNAAKSFTISVSQNPNSAIRSGTVRVTYSGITRSVTVTQSGNSLSFDRDSAVVSSVRANGITFTAYSTLPISSVTVTSGSAWLSASRSGNKITLSFKSFIGSTRTGTVVVKSGNVSKTFTFTQKGNGSVADIAKKYKGKTNSDLGYTTGWCAAFAQKCATEAGCKEIGTIPSSTDWYSYSLMENWFKKNGRFVAFSKTYTPEVGMIVFFDLKRSTSTNYNETDPEKIRLQAGRADHTGIVTAVNTSNGHIVITTLNGNSTLSNGSNGVAEWTDDLQTTSRVILGYGRVTP